MTVQCPKCGAKYLFDEGKLAGRTRVQERCHKCQTSFEIVSEATQLASAAGHLELPVGKSAALCVTNGPLKGKVFRLSKPRVVVGRQGTDIVLEDSGVSRKHCALEVHGNTATLVDLGTTNGTLVDGQKIQSCDLEHLSEFRVGATTLLFTVTDEE